MIAVEGSLRTGSYTDRDHSDVTHYTTDLYVDSVEFCGDKGSNNNASQPQQNAQPAPAETDMSYGNLSEFEEILSDGDVPL